MKGEGNAGRLYWRLAAWEFRIENLGNFILTILGVFLQWQNVNKHFMFYYRQVEKTPTTQ